jgi:serine/threonine-protein kinase PknG
LEGEQRVRLAGELLETALRLAQNGAAPSSRGASLLGHKLVERDLRLGVERSYRTLARGAASRGERIRLVDRANQMRPRTWT